MVDFEDLMIFALVYGYTSADANWNPLCDIAGQGSLVPDGIIDFEDLMIFALHYGECALTSVHNLTKIPIIIAFRKPLMMLILITLLKLLMVTYDESITFPSDKVIILQSINGASSTIIRGNEDSYTVTFDGSIAATILKGFTITHSEGLTGSGIYIVNSNLTIHECTISDNAGGINTWWHFNYYRK